MSRKVKPGYLLHKRSGQARAIVNGKTHYLGRYGSPESRERYERLLQDWFRGGSADRATMTVGDLCLQYLEHAEGYYRKDGAPTGEVKNIRAALRPVVEHCESILACEFGPVALKRVRQAMIDAGHARTNINRNVTRIRGMFKWAIAEELLRPEVLVGLSTVRGLSQGRCNAKESEPVTPIADKHVDAIIPFVGRHIGALIQLQRFTGMRSGEMLRMRGADLNMAGKVWEYIPPRHKTQHRGKGRIIFLGRKSQAIIRPFLKSDLQAFLFSPKEAWAEFVIKTRKPGAKTTRGGRRAPKDFYTTAIYAATITRACDRADRAAHAENPEIPADQRIVPRWHAHQLRHSLGTRLRREFGIESARVALGHSSAVVTEIYAEIDRTKARDVAEAVG